MYDFNDGFKKKAKELIDDTKKLKDEYPEEVYNKIIGLEKTYRWRRKR